MPSSDDTDRSETQRTPWSEQDATSLQALHGATRCSREKRHERSFLEEWHLRDPGNRAGNGGDVQSQTTEGRSLRTPREAPKADQHLCWRAQGSVKAERVFEVDDTSDPREQSFGPARDEPPHQRWCRERPTTQAEQHLNHTRVIDASDVKNDMEGHIRTSTFASSNL